MLCINLTSQDPYFNLAAEEYFLKSGKEDFFIVNINKPSVIIGKHQIAHAETNIPFIIKKSIPVIRRISGGGAVYHDDGNLNFTFIRKSTTGRQVDFRKYTDPITDFLQKQNVNAIFDGKNQINADGTKISGNAEHIYKNRVLHHGTLLFRTSLENLNNALKQSSGKYQSRAVQSNRTQVINMINSIKSINNIDELKSELMKYIISQEPPSEQYDITLQETAEIRELAESKYSTWEWNYGYGPPYIFTNSFYLNNVLHDCSISVKDGIITDCLIKGSNLMEVIAKMMIGKKHMPDELKSLLSSKSLLKNSDVIHNLF